MSSGLKSDPCLSKPISSAMAVDLFGVSHPGLARTTNEDHFMVVRASRALETVLGNLSEIQLGERFEETAYGIVIADGVGAGIAGAFASRQAIYTLLSLALGTPDWQLRWGNKEINTVKHRMLDRFRRVNVGLVQQAAAHISLFGMTTTMTCAITYGSDLIITHVGDSRAYLWRRGSLQLVTRDHTLAQRLIECGLYDAHDPLVNGLRNVLMQTLGANETDFEPEVRHYSLEEGDKLLMCTDGLTDIVGEDMIAAVLGAESSSQKACQSLIELALNHGGSDNVTVVIACYNFPKDKVAP